MSDLLTHWAVFEDCCRISHHDPDVDPVLVDVLEAERDYGRLGAITRGGNDIMPPLLLNARQRWSQPRPDENLPRKVAFVLGCLTHQACDSAMKPLISRVAGADWSTAHKAVWANLDGAEERFQKHNEISAYYDTYVFREIYSSGQSEPFNRYFLADVQEEPGASLEAFIRSLFQRALLSSHTLQPDVENAEAWLDKLFKLHQQLYVDVATYVRVFTKPDPDLMLRYRVETEFYSAEDEIIKLARAIHDGETPSRESLERALYGECASSYAQALKNGLKHLRSASSLWRGETDTLDSPNWVSPQATPAGRAR